MTDECPWCEEPLLEGESRRMVPHLSARGEMESQEWHTECLVRSIAGGLNHQLRLCSCCGGSEPPDPPGMTRRQAAVAACAYWLANRPSA